MGLSGACRIVGALSVGRHKRIVTECGDGGTGNAPGRVKSFRGSPPADAPRIDACARFSRIRAKEHGQRPERAVAPRRTASRGGKSHGIERGHRARGLDPMALAGARLPGGGRHAPGRDGAGRAARGLRPAADARVHDAVSRRHAHRLRPAAGRRARRGHAVAGRRQADRCRQGRQAEDPRPRLGGRRAPDDQELADRHPARMVGRGQRVVRARGARHRQALQHQHPRHPPCALAGADERDRGRGERPRHRRPRRAVRGRLPDRRAPDASGVAARGSRHRRRAHRRLQPERQRPDLARRRPRQDRRAGVLRRSRQALDHRRRHPRPGHEAGGLRRGGHRSPLSRRFRRRHAYGARRGSAWRMALAQPVDDRRQLRAAARRAGGRRATPAGPIRAAHDRRRRRARRSRPLQGRRPAGALAGDPRGARGQPRPPGVLVGRLPQDRVQGRRPGRLRLLPHGHEEGRARQARRHLRRPARAARGAPRRLRRGRRDETGSLPHPAARPRGADASARRAAPRRSGGARHRRLRLVVAGARRTGLRRAAHQFPRLRSRRRARRGRPRRVGPQDAVRPVGRRAPARETGPRRPGARASSARATAAMRRSPASRSSPACIAARCRWRGRPTCPSC